MQLTYVESLRLTMTMLLRRWTPGLDSGDVLTDASEGARCRLHPRQGAHPCCSGYASRRSRRARHIARLTTRGRVARRRFAAPGRVRCRSARLRAAQSPSRGSDQQEYDGVDHGSHAERSQSQAPPEAGRPTVRAVVGASRQVTATVTTARHPRGSCAGSHVRHATRRFGSCLLGRHSRAHRCLRSLGWPSPPSPSGGERGLEKDRLPAPSARRVPPLH